jgi:hypothetical protein
VCFSETLVSVLKAVHDVTSVQSTVEKVAVKLNVSVVVVTWPVSF